MTSDVVDGWKLVPVEPTREMCEAAVRRGGGWADSYIAPRESGVPLDCDISQEDADEINRLSCTEAALDYAAMLSASPPVSVPQSEPDELSRLRKEVGVLREALRTISLMSKEHEHDLFSATQVARAALKEPSNG